MKNVLVIAAVAVAFSFSSAANAAEPMAALGFAGMKKVSKADAMKVRGKGASGYTLSPYVIASSSEYVSQFASTKALSVDFAALKTSSVTHSAAVGLKVDAVSTVQSLNAHKSDFTFIGPSLPRGIGHYGGGFKK